MAHGGDRPGCPLEQAFNRSGHELPQTTDVNSGSRLTHIAWISHAKLLGAWYGAETIISAAYVDTGSNGTGYGFGAMTLGPVILQLPEHKLWVCRFTKEPCSI
jgi:hypothetical protein